MKKMKRILVLLMVCAVAVSMAGCVKLDEMKEHHAIWVKPGDVIKYKDSLYYAIPSSAMLEVWDAKDAIFVTEEDVPTLLYRRYGEALTIGESGILLESYGYVTEENGESYPQMYCREDYYESVKAQIENGPVLSQARYGYWNEEGENLEYLLSAEEFAAVEALLATEPALRGIERYDLIESFSFNLYRASEGGLFRAVWCEIIGNGQHLNLVRDADSDGLVEVYNIPLDQQEVFEKIAEKFTSMQWVQDQINIDQGKLHYAE